VRRELDETFRQVKQVLVPTKGFIDKQMTELEQKIEGICSSNKDLFALLDKVDFDAIFLC
jgi:enoyl reductase-like protein